MTNMNRNSDTEMSMEDILSSIRKYVSEDQEKTQDEQTQEESKEEYNSTKESVISLKADQVITNEMPSKQVESREHKNEAVYQERSTLSEGLTNEAPEIKPKRQSPFEQLTNALNAYGKNKRETGIGAKTVEQLFSEIATQIIQNWVDKKMESFVERIVMREIEKIKAE